MKTLNEILKESLLDADFDVGVEDIYADNITNKVIEIATSSTTKDYDKTVKELYDLLKKAARTRQEQDTSSIMRKMRAKDNTSVYMFPSDSNNVIIFIRKFRKGSRPLLRNIQLFKQANGSSRVYVYPTHPVPHPAVISQSMKETLAFLGPKAWDEITTACINS